MKNVMEHIKARRSVRTFDGQPIGEEVKEKLLLCMKEIENPFQIPVGFTFMSAKENGLLCPVVSGADLYVGGKIKNVPWANAAFGYSFTIFVLIAQSLGLGTVWLGGTMNRAAFEKATGLGEDEMMPCASPVGYPAEKMSVREVMMRKGIKADERLDFEELFFDGSFEMPLTKENANELTVLLEMVRLAPSAVNKQPWRVVIRDHKAHFYLKRSKGFGYDKLDMQMIDMGIALCHFDLAAKANNLQAVFVQEDPGLTADMEYVASYKIL